MLTGDAIQSFGNKFREHDSSHLKSSLNTSILTFKLQSCRFGSWTIMGIGRKDGECPFIFAHRCHILLARAFCIFRSNANLEQRASKATRGTFPRLTQSFNRMAIEHRLPQTFRLVGGGNLRLSHYTYLSRGMIFGAEFYSVPIVIKEIPAD